MKGNNQEISIVKFEYYSDSNIAITKSLDPGHGNNGFTKTITDTNNNSTGYLKETKYNLPDSFSKVFNNLIAHNLFSIGDEYQILDSLRSIKIDLKDPCGKIDDCIDLPYSVEIKVDNKFRNFRLSSLDFYSLNKSSSNLSDAWELLTGFLAIFHSNNISGNYKLK